MLTKIFLIVLAIFIIPMGFFTVYGWSWLQSIGSPQNAVENFNYWSGISWTFLWISSAILLLIANILLWKIRKAWAMWATLGYFIIFIFLKYFWLDRALFQFKQTNGLSEDGFTFAPLLGAMLSLVAIAIVYFNQFLVLRMTDKMHPVEPLPQPGFDEIPDIEIDENEKVN